jgi:predicted ester cyclase
MGIAPTGKPVIISAIEINRISDGQVAEHWVILDQLGLVQQLGVLPASGQIPAP